MTRKLFMTCKIFYVSNIIFICHVKLIMSCKQILYVKFHNLYKLYPYMRNKQLPTPISQLY